MNNNKKRSEKKTDLRREIRQSDRNFILVVLFLQVFGSSEFQSLKLYLIEIGAFILTKVL